MAEEQEPASYEHCDALFTFVVGVATLMAVIGTMLLVLALVAATQPAERGNPSSAAGFATGGIVLLGYALATYIMIIPGKIFLDMARNIRRTALDTADIRRQIAEQNPQEQARRQQEQQRAADIEKQQQKAAQLKAERAEAERLLQQRIAEDKARDQAEQMERERLRQQHVDRTKVQARATLEKITRKAEKAFGKYRDQPDRLDDLVTAILAEVDQLLDSTHEFDEAYQSTLSLEIQTTFNSTPVFQTLQVELKPH